MNDFFRESLYAGTTISLVAYVFGVMLKKKYNKPIFNPLLISIIFSIIILLVANVDYEVYNQSTKYLTWFLTPATVCLAIPLYEQLEVLKRHWPAVVFSILAGVAINGISIYIIAKIMKLSHKEYVTMLPKSITTAIGMGLSEEMNGYVTITVAVIVITGVIGNMFGELVCKIFRITNSIAKGLSIGTSAHAMGTAKAMEMGEVEGAMSSLSVAVTGLMTVGAVLIFENLI